ncbi:MAG: DUF1214 domain-containing protein [Rhizobiaceae bacterium]
MLRNFFLTLLTFSIAIGGGAASVWYALDADDGFEALRVGAWTAFPALGTPDASPYAKAAAARNGVLALGHAEGIRFLTSRDSSGAPLSRACTYKVAGNTPPARFWTLFPADSRSLRPIEAKDGLPGKLQSWAVVRQADGSFTVAVGPHPAPGNWLAISGSGEMALALTLYDTPAATSSEIGSVELPKITRAGCDG